MAATQEHGAKGRTSGPPRRGSVAAAAVALALAAFAAQQASIGRTFRAGLVAVLALGLGSAAILVSSDRARRFAPAVGPVVVSALLVVVRPGPLAWVPAAIGVVLAIAIACGADVAGPTARAALRAGRALTTAIGTMAFVVAVVPAWAWSRLRRASEIDGRARRSGWREVAGRADPGHLGAGGPVADRRTLVGRLAWAIGAVLLVLGADYGIGWAWDQQGTEPSADRATATGTAAGGDDAPVPRDPRVDQPAMASYPWRQRYFDDFVRASLFSYWPYTESRQLDFSSPYINIEGWERQTHRPPGDATGRPTVWVLGGSTIWGEGQRDDHTIPSELARLAERDGLPLTAVNLGQRGWSHFQEMVLFEQRLAIDDPPDIAVFYDGLNEVLPQGLVDEPVPSHYLASAYAEKLVGSRLTTDLSSPSADPGQLLGDLRDAYFDHSAIAKLGRWAAGTPADAAPAQADEPDAGSAPGINLDQTKDEDGNIVAYEVTEQDGIDAVRVYERGRSISTFLAEQHDVEPLFFWQPVQLPGDPQLAALAALDDATIDLSAALDDHPEVYIDGGHTNEEGARLVAEAMWEHLRPVVARWYEQQG